MNFIGVAYTVVGVMNLLKKIPKAATIDIENINHSLGVEVWYNVEYDAVILK